LVKAYYFGPQHSTFSGNWVAKWIETPFATLGWVPEVLDQIPVDYYMFDLDAFLMAFIFLRFIG